MKPGGHRTKEQEEPEVIDLNEKGCGHNGPISLNRRLFMQLSAFGNVSETEPLIGALNEERFAGTLYADLNDPKGVALLTIGEEPDFFVSSLRAFLLRPPFAELTQKHEYTMFGRTYSFGYEADLEHALIDAPLQKVTNPEQPWAVWYPLRRSGAFELLPATEQRAILMEHGAIGKAYGKAGYATDIRLACFGLDKHDNDFVIGLMGARLYPLSSLVQRMRKTKQTSSYLTHLGPFYIGKAIWQNNPSKAAARS